MAAASPFNGALRAINFKGFGLTNANGPADRRDFCTDVFGQDPGVHAPN